MKLAIELKLTLALAVLGCAMLGSAQSVRVYYQRHDRQMVADLRDYKADRKDYERDKRLWAAALAVSERAMPKQVLASR